VNGYGFYNSDEFRALLEKNRKKKELGASLLLVCLLVAVSYLASFGVATAGSLLIRLFPVFDIPLATELLNISVYAAQLLVPIIIYMVMNKRSPKALYIVKDPCEDIGERERITPLKIITYFLAAFSLSQVASYISNLLSVFVSVVLSSFSEGLALDPQAYSTASPKNITEFVLDIVAVAVLPAILEEFMFRGVLLREFLKYGKTFAITASAIFFASVHGSVEQMMYSFVYGIIFGFVAVKTGSLTVGIIIHFINNAYSCTADYLSTLFPGDYFWDILSAVNALMIFFGFLCVINMILGNRFFYSEKKDSEKGPGELTSGEIFSSLVSPVMIVYYLIIAFETLYVYFSYSYLS